MANWTTKSEDIEMARALLCDIFGDEEEPEVALQDVKIDEDGGVWVSRADWVIELEELFQHHYGEQQGHKVTQHVVTELITYGQHIH